MVTFHVEKIAPFNGFDPSNISIYVSLGARVIDPYLIAADLTALSTITSSLPPLINNTVHLPNPLKEHSLGKQFQGWGGNRRIW